MGFVALFFLLVFSLPFCGSVEIPPASGRILVLLMRFTDHVDRSLPTKLQYEQIWETRVHEWLTKQSFGKHSPTFDIMDWRDTDKSELEYSFGNSGRDDRFGMSIQYLLAQLDQDPGFHWSTYDNDNDGVVDNMMVLHSGFNAETFQFDCYTLSPPEERIWSHWRVDPVGWTSPTTGFQVKRYMVTSGLDQTCGSDPATMGAMVMNYLHSWGVPSLYDQGDGIGKGVGKLDVMAFPYGNKNDGIPGALSAYTKHKLEWIAPMEVQENSYVTLGPAAEFPEAVLIQKPYSRYEYLLLENRRKVGADKDLHGSGIAIYHVDETQPGQSMSSYPSKKDDSYPFSHYMVAVLQADGLYYLEMGLNQGDQGDFFQVGQQLGPGMGNTVFPNTDAYQYGYVVEHGLVISVVDECGQGPGKHTTILIKFGDDDTEPKGSPVCELPGQSDSGGAVISIDSRPPRTPRPTELLTRPPRPPSTARPTSNPSATPSLAPSLEPSHQSQSPSYSPSVAPSDVPSDYPSGGPAISPLSGSPSSVPTGPPSVVPTGSPSVVPTGSPSTVPSWVPSSVPSLSATTASPSLPPSVFTTISSSPTTPLRGTSIDLTESPSSSAATHVQSSPAPSDAPTGTATADGNQRIQSENLNAGDTTSDGYDLPGGTIQGVESWYNVSTGFLVRLPSGGSSTTTNPSDPSSVVPREFGTIDVLEGTSSSPSCTKIHPWLFALCFLPLAYL